MKWRIKFDIILNKDKKQVNALMQGVMTIFKSIECYVISFNITKSPFINNLV